MAEAPREVLQSSYVIRIWHVSMSRDLTAVDVQRLAGYERCSFEIQDAVDDVADVPDSAERMKVCQALV